MQAFELNEKWNSLYVGKTIKILRIDAICKPDLFIGVDSDGQRCLTLKVSDIPDIYFEKSELSNLSREYLAQDKRIVIRVLNEYFWDLFNDFIISIYNKIYAIDNVDVAVSEFLKTFNRWGDFFDDKKGTKLSEETIIGLFGELYLINYLLNQKDPHFSISEIENSWVGPYDKGHDFEFPNIEYEVKTKSSRNLDVNIASEYQLQEELGKDLQLVVIDLDKDYIEGISIKNLIMLIKDKLFEVGGDFLFIIDGLKQKNINFNDLEEYDNFRYKAEKIIFYDCLADGFPRLFRESLSPYIRKVRYQIRVSKLAEFIKLEKDL